jgi:hypothetical protein
MQQRGVVAAVREIVQNFSLLTIHNLPQVDASAVLDLQRRHDAEGARAGCSCVGFGGGN